MKRKATKKPKRVHWVREGRDFLIQARAWQTRFETIEQKLEGYSHQISETNALASDAVRLARNTLVFSVGAVIFGLFSMMVAFYMLSFS